MTLIQEDGVVTAPMYHKHWHLVTQAELDQTLLVVPEAAIEANAAAGSSTGLGSVGNPVPVDKDEESRDEIQYI